MKLVVVDLDDTLIKTGFKYEQAMDDAADALLAWSCVHGPGLFDREQARATVREHNKRRVYSHGLLADTFPEAMLEAGRELLGSTSLHPIIRDHLWLIGHAPFTPPNPVVEGAREFLQLFQDHHIPVLVLTEGDDTIQREKLRHFPYTHMLAGARVVEKKSPQTLVELLRDHVIEPEDAWMVGNSWASDIMPALQVGVRAAHLTSYSWERDLKGLDDMREDEVFVSDSLMEIAEHIIRVEQEKADAA